MTEPFVVAIPCATEQISDEEGNSIMKHIILSSVVFVLSIAAQAGSDYSIKSTTELIDAAHIDQVVRLVDKDDQQTGGTIRRVQVVVTDNGLSTDVSPRNAIYLTFASLAEMGNFHATFKLNDRTMKVLSVKKVNPGIYQIKTVDYSDELGLVEVVQTIDSTDMFIQERALRINCGQNFCGGTVNSTIKVSKTTSKWIGG
jgi:hypothetical protein